MGVILLMKRMYLNKTVETLIEDLFDVSKDSKLIFKHMHKEMVRKLKIKLDYINAAPNFQWCIDNPLGKFEPLKGNYLHKYSIRLDKNYRLIVSPNTDDYSREGLSKCEEYYIEGVVDYHGNGKHNWLIP